MSSTPPAAGPVFQGQLMEQRDFVFRSRGADRVKGLRIFCTDNTREEVVFFFTLAVRILSDEKSSKGES